MSTRLVSLISVLALGGLLAGCSADSSDSAAVAPASAERSAGDTSGSGSAADSDGSDDSAGGSSESGSGAKDLAAAGKPADAKAVAATTTAGALTRLVRTAQLTLEVKNVEAAAATVRTATISLGGIVSSETTGYPRASGTEGDEPDAPDSSNSSNSNSQAAGAESVITLRVPEPKMDDALTRIATVGRERDRSTTTEDVTATIADLDSRVSTQTRSVARVRELLDRANSLQDVVLLESELSRREADLESVQARQRALADKAALATITVILRTPGAIAEDPDEAGFLVGLDSGWTGLKVGTTAVLTVVGALLPVAVVLAVIGVPVYLARRRFTGRRPTPSTPAP